MDSKMAKDLFNENCPQGVTTTSLINGKTSGVINLNSIKYQWAYNLWEIMLNNTWFPKEVDITKDITQYKTLTPSEKGLYDKVLAQLIFMDGLQTNNTVDNVNPWITAPEINMCLVRQAMEEALHSQSYAVMVDSISINTNEIYEMWRVDKKLYSKNKHIVDIYNRYASEAEDSMEAKIYMIVANQCLEGIYFYSGFAAMYALARNGKMPGSAQMIKFIQRDEITHLLLFANIFNSMRAEFPESFTEKVMENIRELFKEAANLEIDWGNYITEEGILGLNNEIITNFVHFQVNSRANAIGMEDIYPKVGHKVNPITWFDSFSKINDIKTNFFEGNNAAYSKGSVSMDDF